MGERTVTTTTGEPRRSLMEHGQSMGERSLTTSTRDDQCPTLEQEVRNG
jgi:hypothetical protein